MGTTTDRTLVDSGEGTYIWDHSQDACPDTLVSLNRGRIKVLTNSTASFTDGTAIVAGRDKNQVVGLELKETMILCGRAAQTTHIKSIAVFFHPMEQIASLPHDREPCCIAFSVFAKFRVATLQNKGCVQPHLFASYLRLRRVT